MPLLQARSTRLVIYPRADDHWVRAVSKSQSIASDDDRSRRERADTLVLWALSKRELGFRDDADRCLKRTKSEAERIGTTSSRSSMLEYIDNVWERGIADTAVITASVPER